MRPHKPQELGGVAAHRAQPGQYTTKLGIEDKHLKLGWDARYLTEFAFDAAPFDCRHPTIRRCEY